MQNKVIITYFKVLTKLLEHKQKTVRTAGSIETTHIPYTEVVHYNQTKPRDLDSRSCKQVHKNCDMCQHKTVINTAQVVIFSARLSNRDLYSKHPVIIM